MTVRSVHRLAPMGLACVLLAACTQRPAPAPAPAADAPPPSADAAPAVNPAARTPEAAAAPVASTAGVIASQPGPEGSTWELTKVKVTGNLLTVQWTVRPRVGATLGYYGAVGDISVVDDATSQRYGVVEDQSGKAMVSTESGNTFRVDARRGDSAVAWAKFAAPPAGTSTVSITVPKVGPFDGVPVTR